MDENKSILIDKVVEKLKTVYDPEIPVDIYELGLIYDVKIDGKKALLDMTLTSPHCPVAEILPNQVKRAVEEIKELEEEPDIILVNDKKLLNAKLIINNKK